MGIKVDENVLEWSIWFLCVFGGVTSIMKRLRGYISWT